MPPILNWLASAVPGSSVPTSPLAAQLRDIHPGPPLQLASDPRLLGWWWLLIALLVGAMIILGVQSLLRYHRWRRQLDWQAPDLVPQLQAVLREAVLPRWPEAAALQGAPWLVFLDSLGAAAFASWPRTGLPGSTAVKFRMRSSARRCAGPTSPGDAAASAYQPGCLHCALAGGEPA